MAWFDVGAGLADAGKTVANYAGVLGVESLRASLEEGRLKLANEMATDRESRGRAEAAGYDEAKQKRQQDFDRPGQEASIGLAKAQTEASRSGAAIAQKKDARVEAGINAGGGSVPDSYEKAITAAESRGGKMIPNELGSGAYGPYQFMPQTWQDVRSKNPELNLPEDMKQATPEQHKAAFGRFTTKNAEALQRAGIEPTAANLYLAHRFGAAGAEKVAKAGDETPLGSILPPEWQQQNPDMRGQTVGSFKRLADERMKGVTLDSGGTAGEMPADMRKSREALRVAGELDKVAELDMRWAQEQNKRSAPTAGERERAELGKKPEGQQLFEFYNTLSPEDQVKFRQLKKGDVKLEFREHNGKLIAVDPSSLKAGVVDVPGADTKPPPEAFKKLETEVRTVAGTIDRFEEIVRKNGGGTFDALINNPRSPAAQEYNAAFNTLKTALRSEAFINTGVLQPGENKMIDDLLLSPQSIRGYLADPQSYNAKLNEFRKFLDTKMQSSYASHDLKVPEGLRFYREPEGAEANVSGIGAGGGPRGPADTPRPADKAAYDALPSGTVYMYTDGTMRRKP